MNGKTGVRLQVAEFLKELLNQNKVPALPAADDAAALDAVADACKGIGSVAAASQQLSAALEAADISAPGISAAERAAISNGAAASAGVGSLVIVGAKQLLTVVTAVAALSCEAAGAQVSYGEHVVALQSCLMAATCVCTK
jgi:histidine ammonia-lyase